MNAMINPAGRDGQSQVSESGSFFEHASDDQQPSLIQQYLKIAMRRRAVILGAFLVSLVLGAIVTLLMTPNFTAQSTIEISRESDQVTNFKGVEQDVSVADQEFYQTQYGLLTTRTLAERVAIELSLVDDPAFFDMFNADVDHPAFEQRAGRYLAGGREFRQRIAGEVLLDNVTISPTRLSRLVDIEFTSPEAGFSAKVANNWSESFIETNLERKIQSTSYGRGVLQRQLAEYKERLDASQRQLVTYASQQEIINLPADESGQRGRSLVAEELAALNAELSNATADRIKAEARTGAARDAGSTIEALNNNAINNLRQRRAELSATYERLLVRFEPGYPEAVAVKQEVDELSEALAREEGRVSALLQEDFRQAVQREEVLQARVEELKEEFLDFRRRSIQYNIFEQEVDTNQALYDGLLQRFKEIGVAGGVGVNNIAIVDSADVPQEPSSPRLLLNLLVATLAGTIIGAAAAFVLEQLDESIADPSDIKERLGLSLLGSVPNVEEEAPEDALLDRKSGLVDAYLAIQTNLSLTSESGAPRSFSVTSTRPAEGKSTTALALATMLTRSGKRVILVDGDMRSPSVHSLAGVGHENGLSNYLSGDNDLDAMIFSMEDLGFDAITAGPIPPNAAELLTGQRLSVLVEKLLETYDNVVVDSPPVLGLADAPLIGTHVEGVVYAVEAHGIRTSQAGTAIKRLIDAKVHIFGGVVTKYNSSKARSGYDYDYGYTYGHDAGTERN